MISEKSVLHLKILEQMNWFEYKNKVIIVAYVAFLIMR